MSNYPTNEASYWQTSSPGFGQDTQGFGELPPQQLDFQTFSDQQSYSQPNVQYQQYSDPSQQYPDPNQQYYPNIFTPSPIPAELAPPGDSEFDEPPLLDELEIYPDRILKKTLAVLNPFHSQSVVDDASYLLRDTDIAGPIAFCLTLAIFLFLSGNKAHFGYVYGLSLLSVILMYFLLSLMSRADGVFTLLSVASVLGYCLLPMVALAGLGVLTSLEGPLGLSLAGLAVLWSTLSASRLFITMSGDAEQRPLIAYPCALVNGIFALIVVF